MLIPIKRRMSVRDLVKRVEAECEASANLKVNCRDIYYQSYDCSADFDTMYKVYDHSQPINQAFSDFDKIIVVASKPPRKQKGACTAVTTKNKQGDDNCKELTNDLSGKNKRLVKGLAKEQPTAAHSESQNDDIPIEQCTDDSEKKMIELRKLIFISINSYS